MKVRVKKIKEADGPRYSSAKWEEYSPGVDNGNVSLPVEYEITGEMRLADLKLSRPLVVARDSRNGVKISGYFTTSAVKSIAKIKTGFIVTTDNSVYEIEKI